MELKRRVAFVNCLRKTGLQRAGCTYGRPYPKTDSNLWWNGDVYRGTEPSKALDAVQAGPSRFGCFGMGNFCMWIALRDAMGAAEFDKKFKNKPITLNEQMTGQPLKYPPAKEATVFLPGDFVRFKNADHYYATRANKPGQNNSYSNENAVVEGLVNGEEMYCGFGLGSKTAPSMMQLLLNNYNAGADPDLVKKFWGPNAGARTLTNTPIRIENVRRPDPNFKLP
jgi:hypothetical protein